jgi:hypothetical protein
MDFIRELLLRMEADPQLDGYQPVVFGPSDFPGRTQEEIAYHVDLLSEAGFVKSEGGTMDAVSAAVSRLTWEGHEFLADTKDPGVWEKIKEQTKGLQDVAISVIGELAKAEVKKRLGLS